MPTQTDEKDITEDQGSQSSSSENSNSFDGDLSAKIEELQSSFVDLQSQLKRTQGAADRNVSKSELQELMDKVDHLTRTGVSREDAIAAVENTEQDNKRLADIEKSVLEIRQAVLGTTNNVALDKALGEWELDPKDPFVAAELKDKKFDNQQDIELAVAKIYRAKQKSPNPNNAQSADNEGGEAGETDDAALMDTLKELQKDPVKNIAAIKETKNKLGW